jgi:hypothetical protein
MNFSLNIHRVTEIKVLPARVNVRLNDKHATRIIEIVTTDGTFELALYSEHVDDTTHEGELLEVRA